MRTVPEDKYDEQELKNLNAEQWQVDLLSFNPEYVFWGNYEDYMSDKNSGWREPIEYENWEEFNFNLNELNECVNFYFEIYREHHSCEDCDGSGANKETYQLGEDWYDFEGTGRRWCDKLNEVEIEALTKSGRINEYFDFPTMFDDKEHSWKQFVNENWQAVPKPQMPSPMQVNEDKKKGIGHDAINRMICVKARAEHLGVYGDCPVCEGQGIIYDEPNAKVGLQLWILHPRKGCSRGVYIKEIKKENLEKVFNFLKEAKERNNNRFSKI